ncbi:MAG: thioredoxin-disulfide reductase [Alphaproteobacteria bacterium]|nr:thioredoxin-disulfide reductase [Alphaproteobacteria bacterium]
MAEYNSKVLIIGSGPAGYTSAIYTARAGLNPILVSGSEIGGQLTLSEAVENYPGFIKSTSGRDLMDIMKKQTAELDVTIINDKIVEVDFQKRPFECSSENHNVFYASCIIIATGASAKWLDIASETKYRGFGVSSCATCDGYFYRNKDVVVIGGGNTAAEEALYLTNFARSVTMIHRRDNLRADLSLQEKLRQNSKITIKYDYTVEEIIGSENPPNVEGLRIKNVKSDKTEILKTDGIFIAIGHRPNTEIFKNHLELDQYGYIKTHPDSCATNVEGVFAAGDVKDPEFRQAIIAAGSGAIAAIEATRWLKK